MRQPKGWTREQLIVALKLYCEIPFGKMHSKNPEIIRYAKAIDRTPSALAMKLTNFASLDPKITSTGRRGLRGASQSDREIWEEMNADWPRLALDAAKLELPPLEEDLATPASEDDIECYVGETRSAIVQARIGQAFFRKAVLSAYDFRCCITGTTLRQLLVASHIVPWRDNKANRLNPRNGLCLSAVHDRAFDGGLIAFSDDFRLLLSPKLQEAKLDPFINRTFYTYENRAIIPPKKFIPDISFLKYHRENVFRG